MKVRALARAAVVAGLICAHVVAPAGPAQALFHLIMVTEVGAGTSTAPTAHFIELQMYSSDQRFLTGHQVAVFDASGTELAVFTFTGPVANGANQAYVLLATPQAETEFGVDADFPMTPVLTPRGGSVCFRSADGGSIDCASWGNYSGDDAATGNPFSPALGLLPGRSMARVTTGGSDAKSLDPGDDTNDSAADFADSAPSPTNNAGGAAEPGPEPVDHDRSVALGLRRALVAKGRVSAEGDYAACFRGVAVKIQRRGGGRWKVVARTRTNADGTYRKKMRDRRGRYRALAPRFSPEDGHRCLKGISPIRRNR